MHTPWQAVRRWAAPQSHGGSGPELRVPLQTSIECARSLPHSAYAVSRRLRSRRHLERLAVQSGEALRERFRLSVPPARHALADPLFQNPYPRPLPTLLERREPIEYANALSSKHRRKGNLRSE